MKFKYIVFVILLLFLIGCVVWEEVSVAKALDDIYKQTYELRESTKELDDISGENIANTVENISKTWSKYENNLCFLVNHKDIEDISIELAKLKTYVSNNMMEDYDATVMLILHYCDIYHHIMGISFQNLF